MSDLRKANKEEVGTVRRTLSREIILRKLKERRRSAKPNPSTLAQLHDVFEENEGEEFIGDPMWWRHFEDIEVDRIYIPNSIEFRQVRLMFWEIVFFLFLAGYVTQYVLRLRIPD